MAERAGVNGLNALSVEEAEAALLRCCGSRSFAAKLAAARPFASAEEAVEAARRVWLEEVPLSGWLEAFAAHPRIGNVEGLREKFGSTAGWCEGEQAAALRSADDAVLQELAEWNARYEAKFGHIFIICASGRSSREVLQSMQVRFHNRPVTELQTAAEEQEKITELRLEKLLSEPLLRAEPCSSSQGPSHEVPQAGEQRPWHTLAGPSVPSHRRLALLANHLKQPPHGLPPSALPPNSTTLWGSPSAGTKDNTGLRPPITTHVLDAAAGRPASGIAVHLEQLSAATSGGALGEDSLQGGKWLQVGTSRTDSDGRSGALMEPSPYLAPGTYRLTFETGDYFLRQHGGPGFYPEVTVTFVVDSSQSADHFHVPILLSPFSYTTYRGS